MLSSTTDLRYGKILSPRSIVCCVGNEKACLGSTRVPPRVHELDEKSETTTHPVVSHPALSYEGLRAATHQLQRPAFELPVVRRGTDEAWCLRMGVAKQDLGPAERR